MFVAFLCVVDAFPGTARLIGTEGRAKMKTEQSGTLAQGGSEFHTGATLIRRATNTWLIEVSFL